MTDEGVPLGDVEIAAVAAMLADPGRCRMLLALNDGRALPACVLADEAGVSRPTASSHLAKLTTAGFLQVEQHGRSRYYRLGGPLVGELLETLMRLGPARPVRSLREGTRAAQLRTARTCYDHLAGRLGVAVMRSMIDKGHLIGGDGRYAPDAAKHDGPTGHGRDLDYEVTDGGWDFLRDLGVEPQRGHRPLVRYCIDWSEQRHHLGGRLGRAILDRFLAGTGFVPGRATAASRSPRRANGCWPNTSACRDRTGATLDPTPHALDRRGLTTFSACPTAPLARSGGRQRAVGVFPAASGTGGMIIWVLACLVCP